MTHPTPITPARADVEGAGAALLAAIDRGDDLTETATEYAWAVVERDLNVTRSIVVRNLETLKPGGLLTESIDAATEAVRIYDELRAIPMADLRAEVERTIALYAAEPVALDIAREAQDRETKVA